MPPKRKAAAPIATATPATTAGTSTLNPPAKRRGRPPIMRNNEANASGDQPQVKRQRMTMGDVEASRDQDSDTQSLSETTHDVHLASRVQDISKDHTQSGFTSDLGQKEFLIPLPPHPETTRIDGEDNGEFSTGLRKETSESPAKKTRGIVPRRGKGVLPATRSSPRKQTQQLQTRQQEQQIKGVATMHESSLRSSLPPASSPPPLPSSLQPEQTTAAQLQRVKRKRGRPPKVTTTARVLADSQSIPDQPAVTADIAGQQISTISTADIATVRTEKEDTSPPIDSGGAVGIVLSNNVGRGPVDDVNDGHGQPSAAIVSLQANQTASAPDDIAQQVPQLPPPSPEHHHQVTVSPGLDDSTHPHPHSHHADPHPHPHPSSLYTPSMPYAYAYPHHGAPSHYPFAHPPPPPTSAHPYVSSAQQGSGIEYSPSFASTVSTTPGGSFSNTYHPHSHTILDPNAPHGNPFPPPGTTHIGVPNYAPGVYAVPTHIPSPPQLPSHLSEPELNETELGLAANISVNGGAKRRVMPIASNSGKSGGRAGRGDHVACHFCRGRKLKCDGRRPTCGHCSLRNLACAYDDFIRRRGPGKKEKNSRRSHKSPNSTMSDAEDQSQNRDQNMMLIGPDIAGVGPSSQAEVFVTVPSQSQPQPPPNPLPSIPSTSSLSSPASTQPRRRRNPAGNTGTSAQSGTSILRFDAVSGSEGNRAGMLSSLKPSAVAYAVETNERLPVNVNVGIPSVGMEYYAYHPHPHPHSEQPPGGSHNQHHPHHPLHQHHHMTVSYAQPDQAVGYYTQPHPPASDQGPPAHVHYTYNEEKDEEQDEEDGDEDVDADAEGPNMEENQRSQPQQHSPYDPHSHHAYTHAPPPPPWPTEPPGAHARV